MKRTPLQRKTPLKRLTPLRRVSRKTAALRAVTNPGRKGFVELAGTCMVCRKRKAQECHEICRGNAREECLHHPELWLALCRTCHDELDDTAMYPVERQLAIRIAWEIDVAAMNANLVLGTAQTHITSAGIREWLSNP